MYVRKKAEKGRFDFDGLGNEIRVMAAEEIKTRYEGCKRNTPLISLHSSTNLFEG